MNKSYLGLNSICLFQNHRIHLSNFYSFGSLLTGRVWSPTSTDKYRFGFNGKENTDEIYGEGNGIDFGARIYDGRLGRFYTIDKYLNVYPWSSPFCFAVNNPIMFIDFDGNIIKIPNKKDRDLVLGYFKEIGLEGAFKVNWRGQMKVNQKWIKKNIEKLNNDPTLKEIYEGTKELVTRKDAEIVVECVEGPYTINVSFPVSVTTKKRIPEEADYVAPNGETYTRKTGNMVDKEETHIEYQTYGAYDVTASKTVLKKNSKYAFIFIATNDNADLSGENGTPAPFNLAASFFHELLDHSLEGVNNNGVDPDEDSISDTKDVKWENKVRGILNINKRVEHEK